MKVFYSLDQIEGIRANAVATIGTFDGLHLGHGKVLQTLSELAKKENTDSIVVTFWPHPKKVLNNASGNHVVLFSLEERVEMFDEFDINYLVIIPFDIEFSNTSSFDFIHKIIKGKLKASTLILGYDHRFGQQREGSFEYLQQNSDVFNLKIIEIPRQDVDAMGISSTRIREAILSSNFAFAKNLMGHYYFFTGKVITGRRLGNTIGFPTANLDILEKDKLIPSDGVYACIAEFEQKKYPAMMNIGVKPTVGNCQKTIEVHLINFDGDLYEKNLKVYPIEKLRNEIKFDNLEALVSQLRHDKLIALQVIEKKYDKQIG